MTPLSFNSLSAFSASGNPNMDSYSEEGSDCSLRCAALFNALMKSDRLEFSLVGTDDCSTPHPLVRYLEIFDFRSASRQASLWVFIFVCISMFHLYSTEISVVSVPTPGATSLRCLAFLINSITSLLLIVFLYADSIIEYNA